MSAPDPNLDKHVDDLLAGRSDLSRRYRADSTEQPPADLDRRILAQAAAAVGKDAKVVPLPARSRARWMVPFAVAATVLLSFAIFREAGVGTGVALREEAGPVTLPAPVEAPLAEAQTQSQFMEDRSAAERRSVEAESAESAKVLTDAAPPAPAPVAPPPPVVTPPVALQPPEVAVAVSEAPATNAIQGLANPRSPPARPSPAARAGAIAAAQQDASAASAISVEDWLRDIRKLRTAGRNEDADAALENFLKAYPDYFERNPGVARP